MRQAALWTKQNWDYGQSSPSHTTDAVWESVQCIYGLFAGHSSTLLSVPLHCRLLSQILPCPWPEAVPFNACRAPGNPNWRQTTLASSRSQFSSQTVPHSPYLQISTRPVRPSSPISRTCPSDTAAHESDMQQNKLYASTIFRLFVTLD